MPDSVPGAQSRPESCTRPGSEPNLGPSPGPDPVRRQEEAAGPAAGASPTPVLAIVISKPEEKKGSLLRSDSDLQQCRVCQQQTEEPLIDLGCRCRGELEKVHGSCIEIWFRTKGSNKCEICQHVAANVPQPQSLPLPQPQPQPIENYWFWMFNTFESMPNIGRGERGRGCCTPLWIAFGILIVGLLFDVLISVSLGVSVLPVNIIIGILIVLAFGTAVRLGIKFCQDWISRRRRERQSRRPGMTVNSTTESPGPRPAV